MAASTDPDELPTVLAEQRRELMAAQALDSDLDLAFRLQMEEAIAASLSLHPSTSPPPPSTLDDNDDVFNFAALQTEELKKFEQETEDRKRSLAEFNKIRDDLHRRIHDQKVAADILRIPEEEWSEDGDNYERPYGEGSSSAANVNSDEIFSVYFKGLVSVEIVRDRSVVLAGIGVAICDSKDDVIFEIRKPLIGNGTSRQGAEIRALIEGLHTALALDLKRIVFFVDYYPLFKFVTGRWPAKQRKIATLVNQVSLLQKKFIYCNPSLVARNDIKFAFKLARDAIVSQITGPAESSGGKNLKESCVICLEDTDVDKMFLVDDCQHQYCFSCMKQHVEVKLLHGMVPKCPHEGCKTELNVDSCRKFLTPKLIEIMNQRIKEASIPAMEKLYCPYPRCSALMSKSEVLESAINALVRAERAGARKCTKCQNLFCIDCKVPWHDKMTCHEYKRSNPYPRPEDAKLKSLATMNLWRQCVKCNHMIELAEGCYHMTCRCGYEFCYTCGAEWKNKKATCSCPLWDEENILYDEEDEDFDEEEDEEEEEEEDLFYDSDSDDYY